MTATLIAKHPARGDVKECVEDAAVVAKWIVLTYVGQIVDINVQEIVQVDAKETANAPVQAGVMPILDNPHL